MEEGMIEEIKGKLRANEYHIETKGYGIFIHLYDQPSERERKEIHKTAAKYYDLLEWCTLHITGGKEIVALFCLRPYTTGNELLFYITHSQIQRLKLLIPLVSPFVSIALREIISEIEEHFVDIRKKA